jgi:TetR/AcrR family transcriptional regulator of autoinduction and epiphytic fitness
VTVGTIPRRAQAARTRLRILRSAHSAFVARGYTGTRMVDVAADAQVAVQTVYFTKPELLAACYELAVLGGPGASPPPQQPWHVAMMAASTPAESVAHFVKGNTAICERVAVLDDMVRAAVHEPEAVAVHERGERLRRRDFEMVVGRWAESFGLRPGLTQAACVDLLLTYSGPSTYRQLVVEYGWTKRAYTAWLRSVLVDLLVIPRGTATTNGEAQPATGTSPAGRQRDPT